MNVSFVVRSGDTNSAGLIATDGRAYPEMTLDLSLPSFLKSKSYFLSSV